MKILQTPIRFFPATGGVEKYALDISKELIKNGLGVKVICANEPRSDLNKYHGIRILRLNYCCKIANTNLTLLLPFKLIKEKFDIMHTYLPTPWSADWSVIIAKLKGKRVILSYCNDITGQGIGNVIARIYNHTFLKLTLRLVDKIIIIGPEYLKTSRYLEKYTSKISYIPVGIDTKRFKKINIQKIKNSIFFLSVLDEYHKYKGLDYLLKAIKELKKIIPDIRLIIGGSGKLLNFYKNEAKNLGIQENIEFVGYVPDEKLVEFYNKCQLFVLPSIDPTYEGFGIVLVEALACGTPVVATNVVGMANSIKKSNAGVIIEPKNSKLLKDGILKIIQNIRPYQENAVKLSQEFDIEKITLKIIKLYKNV